LGGAIPNPRTSAIPWGNSGGKSFKFPGPKGWFNARDGGCAMGGWLFGPRQTPRVGKYVPTQIARAAADLFHWGLGIFKLLLMMR
jgi:hypothetical protein